MDSLSNDNSLNFDMSSTKLSSCLGWGQEIEFTYRVSTNANGARLLTYKLMKGSNIPTQRGAPDSRAKLTTVMISFSETTDAIAAGHPRASSTYQLKRLDYSYLVPSNSIGGIFWVHRKKQFAFERSPQRFHITGKWFDGSDILWRRFHGLRLLLSHHTKKILKKANRTTSVKLISLLPCSVEF